MNITEREAARLRVVQFLDGWESLWDFEVIYAVGVDDEPLPRELLFTDLRMLTEVAR